MQQERYHGLDLVRAAAMLLGLLLHVCIFFMPPEYLNWVSGEYNGNSLNSAFLNFIHLFRMQMFFMMAGFFAELVIERKGMAYLVTDRIKRILLPFVVGIVAFMPLHYVITNFRGFYTNLLDGMTLFEKFRALFLFGMFDQDFSFGDKLIHFWFLYYLIIFYAVHFSLRPLLANRNSGLLLRADSFLSYATDHKFGVLLLAFVSFPFQYALQSAFFPPSGYNAPVIDVAFYFLFYLTGILLNRNKHLLAKLAANAWFYLFLSLPFFLYISEPTQRLDASSTVVRDITSWALIDVPSGTFVGPSLWYEGIFHNGWNKISVVFVRAFLCWTMCFAFIGLAHRYLNQQKPAVRYLADSAYWVYWIHLPITFGLSKIAQQIEFLDSLTKCYLVLVISTVIIYWSYHAFVRYTVLGDFFMGRRKVKHDPNERAFSLLAFCKKFAPSVVVLGLFVFLLGSLFHHKRRFSHSDIIVESYVARKRSTLDFVASIDGITDKYGDTPLHAAARMPQAMRRYNPLPLLLEKSSNPNVRNDYGRTPLFTAVQTGNSDDVRRIIDAGADLNIADQFGHTPAHVAAIKTGLKNENESDNFFAILKILVESGADLDLRDYQGRTVADCLQFFGGRRLNER